MSVDVNELFKDLGSLSQIEAIALGGSRVTGQNDASSDYDVYVYITAPIPESERRHILGKYCKYMAPATLIVMLISTLVVWFRYGLI